MKDIFGVKPLIFAVWVACCALLLSGCGDDEKPEHIIRFRITNDARSAGGMQSFGVTLPMSKASFSVYAEPVVLEGDVEDVALAQVPMGKGLLFALSEPAARELYRSTALNQGRHLILFINEAPFGVRQIEEPFANGTIFTFVEMPDAELEKMLPKLQESIRRAQKIKADNS